LSDKHEVAGEHLSVSLKELAVEENRARETVASAEGEARSLVASAKLEGQRIIEKARSSASEEKAAFLKVEEEKAMREVAKILDQAKVEAASIRKTSEKRAKEIAVELKGVMFNGKD